MNEKGKNKIDIFKSVKSEAITGLSPELLETGMDLITDSEVLKDIPIFGIGIKGFSLYQKITEAFFTKKLLKFLIELKNIPLAERKKFINELESKNETANAGERLLITLNRLDDENKATLIGKLFNHTILGKLNYDEFKRLTHIIDNAYIDDLNLLKNNPHLSYINPDVKSNLHQLGLLNQSVSDLGEEMKFRQRVSGSTDGAKIKLLFKINAIGLKFIEYGFE